MAEQCGLSPEEIYDVKLAVNEAVANIIEHAYQWRDDGQIIVDLLGREGELEIHLRDFGRKVEASRLRSRDLDDFRDGGIGLFLIQTLMDSVTYDTSSPVGTELIMVKRHRHSCRGLEQRTGHGVDAG